MTDTSGYDPFGQPGRGKPSVLSDVQPAGRQISINPDGTADIIEPEGAAGGIESAQHFDNLAEFMDEQRLADIVRELLEAIEQDKEARQERDRQYEQGLNRTGMGSNITGGAAFPGASRAVHPLLLESAVDFGGRVMSEMFPPEGPVKAQVIGDETPDKVERAKRVARYMNWQLTELMPSAYHEFEVGMTQCPLGGAFYTKGYQENGKPAVSFIPIDHVYRPWNDGDFYSQPRITHRQNVDRWTYRDNVRSGLWRDVVDVDVSGGDVPEGTQSDQANDRIIGKETSPENIDGIRLVYETSVMMPLMDDEEGMNEPYLITIDVEARECLSIYRNWREKDEHKERLTFLIEWPFWPWRGGYPVGMTHMIGSLVESATGSLRALLDAAHLNNSQTMVRLKGGSTSGGQNIKPRITEITEVAGSLAQDDIRKTVMPLEFNPPNATLFQLLGFLVDAGRGVVRTTFDEYDKFTGQTPVGTAQMFIEQGLNNFGAVHGRLHRSLRRFLKWLYQVNGDTLTPQTIMDQQGEMTVMPQDFQGPMVVIPVSDPRIYSDIQRKAMAQTIAARAQQFPQVYQIRKTEAYFLRQYGAPDPDQFLIPDPQPKQTNAVAENVLASTTGVIKAYPGQDHESHITTHVSYMMSPIFGASGSIAPNLLPKMIAHLGEHLALWYSDAMLEAATTALRTKTGDPMITLESFMVGGVEAPLDKLMAELDDDVLKVAQQKLQNVPQAIMQARDLLKKLAPPTPMDPSAVAMQDVQRQTEADKTNAKLKVIDFQAKREKAQQDAQRAAQGDAQDAALEARQQDIDQALEREKMQQDAGEADDHAAEAEERIHADLAMNADDNATAIEVAEIKTGSAETIAENRPAATGGSDG